MMSWTTLYAKQKYDTYMVIKARSFRNRIFRMDLNVVVESIRNASKNSFSYQNLVIRMRAGCCCSFSCDGGAAVEVVVYCAACGAAQGLGVTQIIEAPHSARRTKQMFTMLPLFLLK